MLKGKVFTMGVPNANGRTYPKEVVENAFKKYKEDMIDKGRSIVFSKNSEDLAFAYGLVKDYSIEDNDVFVKVKPLQCIADAEMLTDLLEKGKIHFVTAGIGKIEDGIVQDDFELRYIFLDPEPSYLQGDNKDVIVN